MSDATNPKRDRLNETALQLVAQGKGVLAADESPPTIERRFREAGITCTSETRRSYRDILFTTPGIERYLSGVILSDEAMHQTSRNGTPFAAAIADAGMVPGVKVDLGLTDLAGFPGEQITTGLDGLRSRLEEYASMGAWFTKWRAVLRIGRGQPTSTALAANAEVMARFAALSQEAGLVPIAEPEVLMDGDHSLQRCATVTGAMLRRLFGRLVAHRVRLEGMLLKVNMALPGRDNSEQANPDDIARATVSLLRTFVPAVVPGVLFLSGGQDPLDATARLDAINRQGGQPWQLTFSFSRALLGPVLTAWNGDDRNRLSAQGVLVRRAWLNGLARDGRYETALESGELPGWPPQTHRGVDRAGRLVRAS